MNKHIIWHNDKNEIYENVKAQRLEDIEEEFGETNPELDENELLKATQEDIYNWFKDEIEKLDIDTDGEIILVGSVNDWVGKHNAYLRTEKNNIGLAINKAVRTFNEDDHLEIYIEGNKLLLSQKGHDNPVNPTIAEFRILTVDFDDLANDNTNTLIDNSISIGKRCAKEYSFATERTV